MNRFLLFLLFSLQTCPILAQENIKDGYLRNWSTDVLIWYNSGGWYSLLNYFFKGDAKIEMKIEEHGDTEHNIKINYVINNYRLREYHYFDIRMIPIFRPHLQMGYNSIGIYYYNSDFISYKIVTACDRLVYWNDIKQTYQLFGKYISHHSEVFSNLGRHSYKGKLVEKNSMLTLNTDSFIMDSSTVLTPYIPTFCGQILTKTRFYKDCVSYKTTPNNVCVRILGKDKKLFSELSIDYNSFIPYCLTIDDKKMNIFCIRKDHKGNWLKLECYDTRKKEVVYTITRKIKYH